MARSTKNVVRKRRGRPATGQDPVTAIRLSPELRKNVDGWAAKQSDQPKRSEAIRRLVELGLAREPAKARAGKPGRRKTRARELAITAIEQMIDPSAPPEERVQRRQRLTKGPPEFREDRVDQPKAKGKSK
jgi:hypothetical protein